MLTIDTTPLLTPAWVVLDDLWGLVLDADVVTGDVILPHAPGRATVAFEPVATKHTLIVAITGEVDAAGVPHLNEEDGFTDNFAAFAAGVNTEVGTNGDGTSDATLTTPGGDFTAAVKVGPVQLGGKIVNVVMSDDVTRRCGIVQFDLTVMRGAFITQADAEAYVA